MVTPRNVGRFLLAASFLLFVAAVWTYQSSRAALDSWREVEAMVVRSEAVELPRTRVPGARVSNRYNWEREIRYVAGGIEYSRRDVRRDMSAYDAMASVRNQPPGTRLKMRYNPDNPAEILSEQAASGWPIILSIFGAILAVIGVVLLETKEGDTSASASPAGRAGVAVRRDFRSWAKYVESKKKDSAQD